MNFKDYFKILDKLGIKLCKFYINLPKFELKRCCEDLGGLIRSGYVAHYSHLFFTSMRIGD